MAQHLLDLLSGKKNTYNNPWNISLFNVLSLFFFLLAFSKRSGVHRPTGRTTVKRQNQKNTHLLITEHGFNLANGFPCVLAQFYLTIASFNYHTNLEKKLHYKIPFLIPLLPSSSKSSSRKKKKSFKSMKIELLIWLFLIVSLKVLSSSACTADNSSCKPQKKLKRKQAFPVVFICLNHSFNHEWLGL